MPNNNTGSDATLLVSNAAGGIAAVYIRFATDFQDAIPARAIITSATLRMNNAIDQSTLTFGTVGLLRDPWVERTLTWNNSSSEFRASLLFAGIRIGWIENDITKFVGMWHGEIWANHGMVTALSEIFWKLIWHEKGSSITLR